MDDSISPEEKDRALSFLTTEHAALQNARFSCIIELNGRVTGFLAAVSSAIIALAFVGQVTRFDVTFFLFALTLLPALAVLGFITFVRTLQNRIEDSYYARAINRIRHYYLEVAPHARSYLSLPWHDDLGSLESMAVHSSRTAPLMTRAGSMSFVNSVLVGVSAGLAGHLLFGWQVFASTGAGAAAFLVSLAVHYGYQRRRWRVVQASFESRFPSSAAPPFP